MASVQISFRKTLSLTLCVTYSFRGMPTLPKRTASLTRPIYRVNSVRKLPIPAIGFKLMSVYLSRTSRTCQSRHSLSRSRSLLPPIVKIIVKQIFGNLSECFEIKSLRGEGCPIVVTSHTLHRTMFCFDQILKIKLHSLGIRIIL